MVAFINFTINEMWTLELSLNKKHVLFLVFFVSVTTLILSTNDAFADQPDANAGANQTVDEGATVTLDGSTTHGEGATFQWSYEGDKKVHKDPFKGKNGVDNNIVNPTFTAREVKEDTTITFSLIVTAGGEDSVASTVEITILNKIPIANAGIDQTVTKGDIVTLNGTLSSDPNGDSIKYKWKYENNTAIHADPFKGSDKANNKSVEPTFTAGDVNEDVVLRFSLIVEAGQEKSVADTVDIKILATAATFAGQPVADAGIDQIVNKGDTVTLNAENSTAGVTYKWKYESDKKVHKDPFKGNNGADDTVKKPSFNVKSKKVNTVLVFKLIVTNGTGSSNPDFMTITVLDDKRVDFKPTKTGDNLKGKKDIGKIKKDRGVAIKIEEPETLVIGTVKQLVISVKTDAVNNVEFDFTQDTKIPAGIATPDIVIALFLDLIFTGIDLTQSSSFTDGVLPKMPFSIKSDFESLESFADGCPVMSFQLLDEVSGTWEQLGDPQRANAHKIYVSNFDDSTVSVIDGSTNNIVATISAGIGDTPESLSFDNTTNRVYLANNGTNIVTVINTAGDVNTVIANVTVGTNPSSIAINESTNRVYVTNYGSNTVSVIDTDTNNVIDTITTVGIAPSSVAVHESSNTIYVTNSSSSNSLGIVSIINYDGNDYTTIANVTVGTNPSSIAIENSTRAFVANSGDNTVSVINTATNTVIATIPTETTPVALSINNATKKLYVANSGSGSVSIIDMDTYLNIANVTTGSGASDIVVNPSTDRIYVANSGAGTVSIIDGLIGSTTEDEVIDTITGFSNNVGITLNPTIPNPVRDPSTDVLVDGVISECGYIATPPHFSKFSIGGVKALAIAALASGGGGVFGSAPIFLDSSVVSLVDNSGEFGGKLSSIILLEEPQTLFTDEKYVFRFDLYENKGINNILYAAAYFNIRGDEGYNDSDTQIIFKKNKPLSIIDPTGLFSDVTFKILERDETNLVLQYEITFSEPMEMSHLLLRTWNLEKWSSEKMFYDAIEIISMDPEPGVDDIVMDPEPGVDDIKKILYVPEWIKNSVEMWNEDKINDDAFIQVIQFLVQEQIIDIPIELNISEVNDTNIRIFEEEKITRVPDWVKDSAGWWVEGLLSDEEFIDAIKFLLEKETIVI